MKLQPMYVVVRDDFIPSLAFASFVPIEVRKSIINKPRLYADISLRVARYDLVVNQELVQGTSVN
jgi:hypothetical protein